MSSFKNLTGVAKLVEAARQKHIAAMQKYNTLYDNRLYVDAVMTWMARYGETDFYGAPACEFGFRLGDAALALCGSPNVELEGFDVIEGNDAAVKFLLLFAE